MQYHLARQPTKCCCIKGDKSHETILNPHFCKYRLIILHKRGLHKGILRMHMKSFEWNALIHRIPSLHSLNFPLKTSCCNYWILQFFTRNCLYLLVSSPDVFVISFCPTHPKLRPGRRFECLKCLPSSWCKNNCFSLRFHYRVQHIDKVTSVVIEK